MVPITIQPDPVLPQAPDTYTFIVTLLNRSTGDEQALEITSLTDSFLPVLREIQWARDMAGLNGYDIFEVLDLNTPF